MQIGIVAGDGIGTEVVAEGLKVIAAAGVQPTTVEYDLGGVRYLQDGTVLPDSVLEEWRSLDALYFGAVGAPGVPPGVIERGLLLRMRFELDLYVNLRPFRLPENEVDMVVVRENTEGTYAGEGGFLRKDTPFEIATQGSVNTRHGVERCVRFACELAESRPAKHIDFGAQDQRLDLCGRLVGTHLQRSNRSACRAGNGLQPCGCGLAIYFVESPQRYDVIVTDNLFGDILTDLGGAVSGGIGKAASANLNPDRTGPSMFEPVHGSAPDIAGQGLADPTAAILSAAMMLDFLGEATAAAAMSQACDQVSAARDSQADSETQAEPRLLATPSPKPLPISSPELPSQPAVKLVALSTQLQQH